MRTYSRVPFILQLVVTAAFAVAAQGQAGEQQPNVLEQQAIPTSLSALQVVGKPLTAEEAAAQVQGLIKALNLRAITPKLQRGKERETYSFRAPGHTFKVFAQSGVLKYRTEELYRLSPHQEGENAPPRETVLSWAERDLKRLAAANFLTLDELDRQNIHISHQSSRTATRDGEKVQLGKLSVLDSRIDFTRRIGELRVAGNGVGFIYGNDGRLHGLEIVWRRVRSLREKMPLAVSKEQALSAFRETTEPSRKLGSTVDLLQAELVYGDPSPRRQIGSLQPAYFFLYRVRTPIEGRTNEFVVGKKRLLVLRAVKR